MSVSPDQSCTFRWLVWWGHNTGPSIPRLCKGNQTIKQIIFNWLRAALSLVRPKFTKKYEVYLLKPSCVMLQCQVGCLALIRWDRGWNKRVECWKVAQQKRSVSRDPLMDLVWGLALLPSLCKMIPKPWMRKIQLLLHTQGKMAYKTPKAKVKKCHGSQPYFLWIIHLPYGYFAFFLNEVNTDFLN